jgi:hypothetical protein
MNLLQSLRRMGQQLSSGGCGTSIDALYFQLGIIEKLYAKNGLSIKNTCPACPEQYDVFKDGNQVGYLRLRHGKFRVDYPECGGETLFYAEPKGDGIFENDERLVYMTAAMRTILTKIKSLTKQ